MGRGRPKLKEPKSKTVKIRMTEQEYENLHELSDSMEISMSDVIRMGLKLLISRKM